MSLKSCLHIALRPATWLLVAVALCRWMMRH